MRGVRTWTVALPPAFGTAPHIWPTPVWPRCQISKDNAPSLPHSTLLPSTDGYSPLAGRWVENTLNIIKEIRLIDDMQAEPGQNDDVEDDVGEQTEETVPIARNPPAWRGSCAVHHV